VGTSGGGEDLEEIGVVLEEEVTLEAAVAEAGEISEEVAEEISEGVEVVATSEVDVVIAEGV